MIYLDLILIAALLLVSTGSLWSGLRVPPRTHVSSVLIGLGVLCVVTYVMIRISA